MAIAPETNADGGADGDHKSSFGVVYAIGLAGEALAEKYPSFPAGSIIVREKNETETSSVPQTVIAMAKRPKGFSHATNDWEFFLLSGADLNVKKRETAGNCSACHVRAEKTDWIFR